MDFTVITLYRKESRYKQKSLLQTAKSTTDKANPFLWKITNFTSQIVETDNWSFDFD